jgi:DNA (cytosine-5)-methyltransferase 1
MRHGSLFSGIGGFDLAAEWMGWENVFHCEKEKFCQQVLNYYWPNATLHEDIRNTDFTIYRYRIDILTGGFPCQPYSTAGKRLGKEDDRHLWPEMLRAIREISPRWIVGENVRGLTNWNGGLVFDEVQADLEAEGYEVIPFLLPACAVNAPHRRDRIWFVAYANKCSEGPSRTSGETESDWSKNNDEQSSRRKQTKQHIGRSYVLRDTADTTIEGLEKSRQAGFGKYEKKAAEGMDNRLKQSGALTPNSDSQQRCEGGLHKEGCEKAERYSGTPRPRNTWGTWENFPTQPPVCSGDDGLPSELDGITFSKWRNESIKGYGNAVVPQVVYQIFKAIEQYETIINTTQDRPMP